MDETLIERARGGDREAMERLLDALAPAVHRFGTRMCRNDADADDILQDTLLAVATHLGEFEARSSLTSWVFALTRSACARRRRGLKNQPMVTEDAVPERIDEGPGPDSQAERREIATALAGALERLPDALREVVVLRDVEGLTAPEAAASVGITVEALKSRLHRGRAALRDALRPVLEPMAPAPGSQCPEVAILWSRKLEGELGASDCAEIEKHVASCPACSSACDTLRQALLACSRSRDEPVPARVQARVKAALAAWAEGRC